MIVAVTGGIGSGKSAVMRFFKERGAKIIDADEINRGLLNDPEYVKRLEYLFPDCVKSGVVDKKALGNRVFHDESELKKLNALAHPLIFQEIERQAKSSDGFCAVEIPLLGQEVEAMRFDRIIAVTASESTRIKRITVRDGVSEAYARAVIAAQKGDAFYRAMATDVLRNDGSVAELERAAEKLLQKWGVTE